MREIKFRQWHGKQFTYWGMNIDYPGTFTGPSTVDGQKSHESHQQFTGLKDAKGVEICEGDIVRQSTGNLVVEYHEGSASFIFTKDPADIDAKTFRISPDRDERKAEVNGLEVIGNIHENPDLLSV